MPEGQRHVAGLWCGDVLACLPDLVDGALDPATEAAVRAHVGGCDWCERFGGRYGGLVAALRGSPAPPIPAGAAERLDAALAKALGGG